MKIFRWITNNFWTKVSSVCLAILVWLYVSGEQNMDVVHEIPVQLKLPKDSLLVHISRPSLRVTLRGARSIVQNLDPEKIQYSRDVSSNIQPGNITFVVSEKDMILPKFVSAVNFMPSQITLSIDSVAEKELAVEPQLSGTPMEGFKVDGVSVSPASVRIKGPSTILKRSSKIGTQQVDLTGRNRSFFQKVGLSSISNGQESDILVEVYVRIREEVEQKTFENHPIKVLQSANQNWDTVLEPPKVKIVLGGNKEILSKITSSEITIFLDIADLKPGTYELPIQATAPKEVTILSITPANIKVQVKEIIANSK